MQLIVTGSVCARFAWLEHYCRKENITGVHVDDSLWRYRVHSTEVYTRACRQYINYQGSALHMQARACADSKQGTALCWSTHCASIDLCEQYTAGYCALDHQLLAKEALVGDCARQPESARNVRRLLTCLRVGKVSRGVPERHMFLLAGRRRGWMEHLARSLRCRPLCLCIARSPKQAPAPRCRWLDMKSRWMPAPGFCATPSWCTVTYFCGEPILKRGHVEASKRSSLHRVRSASAT